MSRNLINFRSPAERRQFLGLSAAYLACLAAACRRAKDRAYSRGNTLIWATLNDRPLRPGDWDGEWLVFLPLVKENLLNGDRQGCLATSWEHSADYREWTYRLRPNVRWHDGRPVTMDDVKFTLDLYSRPDNPYSDLPLSESVTVHDPSTFTVRGINWSSGGGNDWQVGILPKHLLQHLDYQKVYDWDFWLRPVGNGPYRYLRYDPQTMMELEANPDYYKGKPKIARVVLKFAGQAAGLTELLSGNVDAITLNPAQLPSIANDPRFQTYWWRSPSASWAIWWQTEHPLFRDREVRRALSLAINRRELLQILNLPGQLSRIDGVSTLRQIQRGEQLPEPRYDPAEARRLLDEAGWHQRSRDGTREGDGHDFRFTALTLAEAPGAEAAVYVQAQLRKIGVEMELQSFEMGALLDRLKAGRFEAMLGPFGYSDGELKESFGTRPGAYQNPQLTRLLEVVGSTADPEVIDNAYREISDILRTDQPVAFLFPHSALSVVHRRVKGLSAGNIPLPFPEVDELWLEEESQQ